MPLLLAPLLLAGCHSTLTNLSAQTQPRNANNVYPIEVSFNSDQQSLLWGTIQPYVKVGDQLLPLRQTPLITNRWEGLLPVPADAKAVDYQYKFDFRYYNMGQPETDSVMSHKYTLRIVE
ncbi:MAG TPA: hypothetical protein VH251_11950 [Verrucomicrobiae bacterium]|nr:hypothetical protein [Verrucomicrobiae bacterium]